MPGLKMKYFVLKPHSKTKDDPYANASRQAMLTYADEIREENHDLFLDLIQWVQKEVSDNAR